jgi:aminoglycoside phosphotransferase (APT) family kinase protein
VTPSPRQALAAVRRLTPLAARQATKLGRGADSVAYLVDREWVFRFPVAQDAQVTLRREIALLPDLGSALPLATPAFEHIGSENGRLRFVGYRVLAGEPLTGDRFDGLGRDAQEQALASLAGFLRALHAFPLDVARHAGVAVRWLQDLVFDARRGDRESMDSSLRCLRDQLA